MGKERRKNKAPKGAQDWRAVLGEVKAELDQEVQVKKDKEVARIEKVLCNSFISSGRVVVNEDDAKVNYQATQEAIQKGGLQKDIEDLIESSLKRGELVIHNYELYSLQALIQEPFWDKENGRPRQDWYLTIEEIKTAIAEKYSWTEEKQYQEALDLELNKCVETQGLWKLPGRYLTPNYVFIKQNMPQLNPLDGGRINPFLRDPFTGKI